VNNKWWILAAMTSCISMIFIDITVLPVALPTIERLLGISETGLHWIVNAYTLALTVLVLPGGRLGDMLGHRKVFFWGLTMFALFSALCGLSNSGWWFIASRALQGVGGALLLPCTTAILMDAFPYKERGKAMGIYIGVGSIFLATGPFVGGIFTQYVSWRLVFWINVPIALIGFILAYFSVPRTPGKKESFDVRGFLTLSLGVSAIVVALMEADVWSWSSPLTLGLLALGLVLLALLIYVDRHAEKPYIDFSLFKERTFLGTLIAIFCTQFMIMLTVFWSIYFQTGLDFSPAKSGWLSLLGNSPLIITAPLGGYLLDRFGPRVPITIGFCLVLGALFFFYQVYDTGSIPLILASVIPFGCGIPMIITPCMTSALQHTPVHKRGLASGTLVMLRQLGSTLGLAVFGSLFLSRMHINLIKSFAQNPDTASVAPEQFTGILAKTPSAVTALEQFPEAVQGFITKSFELANNSAFAVINLLGIAVMFVGFLAALFLIKKNA